MEKGVPVIVGLSLGIAFVLLFATFFGGNVIPFSFSQYKALSVQTALRNSTLIDLFEGKVPAIQFYRDHGVGHKLYDCTPRCAIMLFTDPSNPERGSASVLVNPVLGKVFEVRASNNLIIAKTDQTAEVKALHSRYPITDVSVDPVPGNFVVIYKAEINQSVLSLVLKTTPDGELVDLYAECNDENGRVAVTTNISIFIERTNCLSD